VGDGNSSGSVDSPRVGIIPVVFGKIVELGVVVEVNKPHAMDADRIDINEIILENFIFPPEKI
jgi:hypothetical protein